MAIVMMVEIPGADTAFADGMRQAGILDALQTARGFRGHWSGASSSGYRAIELWDSREDCQAFAESNFAPNLPPGLELPPMEFFELNFEVKPTPQDLDDCLLVAAHKTIDLQGFSEATTGVEPV